MSNSRLTSNALRGTAAYVNQSFAAATPAGMSSVQVGDMRFRESSAFLSPLAAALIMLTPMQALAQDVTEAVSVAERPRPEYDPVGRQVGAFMLNASLDIDGGTTDNVFAAETNEQDDTFFDVAPEVRLTSGWSRHALELGAGARFRNHSDFEGEDSDTSWFSGYGRVDVTYDTQISGRIRVSDDVEPRTSQDALALPSPVEYATSDASVMVQHRFNRVRLAGTLGRYERDFDDVGAFDQDFRDFDEEFAVARAEVELSPRVAAVVEGRFDERNFDNAPGLSSNGQTYRAGVRLGLTNLIAGEITVGQTNRDYDNGLDVETTALAGELEWYPTQLTTVTLTGRRDVSETGATTTAAYVNSDYSVRVDHELLRNLIVSAEAGMVDREYEVIDRDDNENYLEVGALYLVNRRFALHGRFERIENESDGLDRDRDFEVNRFIAGVSFRL